MKLSLYSIVVLVLIRRTECCGCGGCNYVSDIACARCCTAYVKRASPLEGRSADSEELQRLAALGPSPPALSDSLASAIVERAARLRHAFSGTPQDLRQAWSDRSAEAANSVPSEVYRAAASRLSFKKEGSDASPDSTVDRSTLLWNIVRNLRQLL